MNIVLFVPFGVFLVSVVNVSFHVSVRKHIQRAGLGAIPPLTLLVEVCDGLTIVLVGGAVVHVDYHPRALPVLEGDLETAEAELLDVVAEALVRHFSVVAALGRPPLLL